MNTSTSTLKLMTIVQTQSKREWEVIAKDAQRAKMLVVLQHDTIRIKLLKVKRSINLDNRKERIISG